MMNWYWVVSNTLNKAVLLDIFQKWCIDEIFLEYIKQPFNMEVTETQTHMCPIQYLKGNPSEPH